MTKLKFVVTGSGRSGTNYMCRFLTSVGIMCGHESIFTNEGLTEAVYRLNDDKLVTTSLCSLDETSWFDAKKQIAESSYLAAPYLDDTVLENTKIIHLIRNPLKVISSTHIDANFFNPEEKIQEPFVNFVYSHLPQLKLIENRLEKNIIYYIFWNKMIEEKCKNRNVFLHKIENGITEELFEFLEIKPTIKYYNNNKSNSWNIRKKDLDFENISKNYISSILYDMMEKYDYLPKKCLI